MAEHPGVEPEPEQDEPMDPWIRVLVDAAPPLSPDLARFVRQIFTPELDTVPIDARSRRAA